MRVHDPLGTGVAVGFIALAAFLIVSAGRMSPMGSVFPIAISCAMILFAAVLVARNVVLGIRGDAAEPAPHDEAPVTGGSPVRRVGLVAAMGSWIALIPIAGFFPASVLGYFALTAIAIRERMSWRGYLVLAAIGLAMLAALTLLMSEVLRIPLPRGVLY